MRPFPRLRSSHPPWNYGRGRLVFHFAFLLFVLATIIVAFFLLQQADGMASGGNDMPTKNKWMDGTWTE